MIKYSQYFAYSMLATLAGLPVGCVVGGLLTGFYALLADTGNLSQFPKAFAFGLFVAMVAAFIGILPSFLYGAPFYALLSKHKVANGLTASLIGVTPGLLVLPFEPNIAVLVLLFGGCVSLTTHLFAKRRLAQLAGTGANNSFKPKPLRGSA
ncbi:hypothetical protein [Lysobacter solisilvae (ex Woo and Kim 2020)]|uniref:Uncharacterized protein n=1 Tax=Agrilutibacter terrestris TaxID=2865112 RepID=A0A7H0FVX1_9GAMM|nr:hypothetical protein [Lysobacter terrestris]QNP40187.1 hypothetical protein H8B22_11915 [Lysobacter terrestris]